MSWFLLLPVSWLALLIGVLASPVLPLLVGADGHFPKYLHWFDWPDNDIDGDRGWRTDLAVGSWKRRAMWCLKNPCYNFDVFVLGAFSGPWLLGNPLIKNRDQGVTGGYFYALHGYWNIKIIVKLWRLDRCVMWEWGWKMQDMAKGLLQTVRPQFTCPLLLLIPRFTEFNP